MLLPSLVSYGLQEGFPVLLLQSYDLMGHRQGLLATQSPVSPALFILDLQVLNNLAAFLLPAPSCPGHPTKELTPPFQLLLALLTWLPVPLLSLQPSVTGLFPFLGGGRPIQLLREAQDCCRVHSCCWGPGWASALPYLRALQGQVSPPHLLQRTSWISPLLEGANLSIVDLGMEYASACCGQQAVPVPC